MVAYVLTETERPDYFKRLEDFPGIEAMKGVPCDLGCGRSVFVYDDDVAVLVSSYRHLDLTGDTLKKYELVTRIKINVEMSVGLQLGT